LDVVKTEILFIKDSISKICDKTESLEKAILSLIESNSSNDETLKELLGRSIKNFEE
ncbi:hypothetical protein SK128_007964, partial [Halocaridina rubra]